MLQKQTVIPIPPSSEIISGPSSKCISTIDSNKMFEGSGHMHSIDSIDWQPSSFPALKIERPDGSDQLLITIITPKCSTNLTSKLYEVLDEEILDVLQSDISSTKERVLHLIRVNVIHVTADIEFIHVNLLVLLLI